MKNNDYIEGFINGVSMCWNNGMKICPKYTAIYIDVFFIDGDKNDELNDIIYEKLISVYIKMSDEDKKMMWPED